jgi:hypothetical protein
MIGGGQTLYTPSPSCRQTSKLGPYRPSLFHPQRIRHPVTEGVDVACLPAEGHHRPVASLPSAGILQPWRPVAILLSNGDFQPPRGRGRTARAPFAFGFRRRRQMVKVQDVNLGLPMTSPDPQAPQPVMHLRVSGLHDFSRGGRLSLPPWQRSSSWFGWCRGESADGAIGLGTNDAPAGSHKQCRKHVFCDYQQRDATTWGCSRHRSTPSSRPRVAAQEQVSLWYV